MAEVHELARFIDEAAFERISDEAVEQLKLRILDSLGVAIGAIGSEPTRMVRQVVEEFAGTPDCSLIGGGRAPADRATLYNGALVRYLDFMDSYLAPGETCHPSDNLAAVLAAGEFADLDGEALLTALAVAYQVHCRLSDEAPVRRHGFDHTTQGAYAVAAGVSKALELEPDQTANAIAIAGTANVALRVTRTGALSHWKGLAYPNTAFGAMHAAFLARAGITGPPEVFEGAKGFKDSIVGDFAIDWPAEDLERVTRTIIKKYNAEIHSQSLLEGALELKERHEIRGEDVARIQVKIFDVAYHIIGGGEEGGKKDIRTKEAADHSIPYLAAAALLDGEVGPVQFAPDRITADDVQSLLQRVEVEPDDDFSARFPDELPCHLTVEMRDGQEFAIEKTEYEGFFTQPMTWESVIGKFHRVAEAHADDDVRDRIIAAVRNLPKTSARDLGDLLRQV
jgi:2-methylcitrate dehydratase